MGYFGLELEKSKSRLIEFGRYTEENRKHHGKKNPETFTFLGFTHYCSPSKSGNFSVKRKTSKKKFAKKCKEVHRLISSIRHWTLRLIIAKPNQILVGYYHYYGITDNFRAIDSFRYRVRCSLFYWLNRRSQKTSYIWNAFNNMLKVYPLAKPRIYVSIYGTYVNNSFCREPNAGKSHVRFCVGVRPVRGVSTHQVYRPFMCEV